MASPTSWGSISQPIPARAIDLTGRLFNRLLAARANASGEPAKRPGPARCRTSRTASHVWPRVESATAADRDRRSVEDCFREPDGRISEKIMAWRCRGEYRERRSPFRLFRFPAWSLFTRLSAALSNRANGECACCASANFRLIGASATAVHRRAPPSDSMPPSRETAAVLCRVGKPTVKQTAESAVKDRCPKPLVFQHNRSWRATGIVQHGCMPTRLPRI